jgi:hypothetical protein
MGKERIQKSEYRRQKGNQENWNIKYGKNGMMEQRRIQKLEIRAKLGSRGEAFGHWRGGPAEALSLLICL